LADRWELDRLQRILKQKEAAMKAATSSAQTWMAEATSWIQQAREMGLIEMDRDNPTQWPDILDLLCLDLSRFSSGLFRAIFAMKETKVGTKIQRRVQT
jgi:hypothetical protein